MASDVKEVEEVSEVEQVSLDMEKLKNPEEVEESTEEDKAETEESDSSEEEEEEDSLATDDDDPKIAGLKKELARRTKKGTAEREELLQRIAKLEGKAEGSTKTDDVPKIQTLGSDELLQWEEYYEEQRDAHKANGEDEEAKKDRLALRAIRKELHVDRPKRESELRETTTSVKSKVESQAKTLIGEAIEAYPDLAKPESGLTVSLQKELDNPELKEFYAALGPYAEYVAASRIILKKGPKSAASKARKELTKNLEDTAEKALKSKGSGPGKKHVTDVDKMSMSEHEAAMAALKSGESPF